MDLEAGKTYRIDLEGEDTGRGTLTDPVLDLKELGGGIENTPATDDNSGEGMNARITFTPDVTKTYYLVVQGKRDQITGQNATGTYRLRVREVIQPWGGPKFVQANLEPGDSASGTFEQGTWYYFALEGLTSGRYTVSFTRGPIYTLYAPMTGTSGDILYVMTNQPRGAKTHAFDVHPRTTQTRYVEVYVNRDAGDYTVTLKKTGLNLVVGGPPVASQIPAEDSPDGLVGGPWGVAMKFFGVELKAGERYQVNILGRDADAGTMDYPMLGNIAAPDGSYVGGTNNLFINGRREVTDNRGNVSYDNTVHYTFTADQDGTYYVKAGGALWKVFLENGNYSRTRYRAGTFKVSIQRR